MKSIFALFVSTLAGLLLCAAPAQATPIPDDCKTGGFAIGCQAWTFNHFTVFEAIDKTAAAGGKVIEFYPGQKLSPNHPDLKFDHNVSDDIIDQVKAHLKARGLRAVNYGVVGIPSDEAGARKVFEFAKKLDLYGITTESVDSIDMIEKMVKEYDIRVGFHDHPRRRNDPSYRNWDPQFHPERDQRSRPAHRFHGGHRSLGALGIEPGGLPENFAGSHHQQPPQRFERNVAQCS